MRYIWKLILLIFVPVFAVYLLTSLLGFDSTSEMIKALIEEIIPFGNVIAKLIDGYQSISIGKTLTVTMITNDILKTIIASFLFTFVMRFVNLIIGITSKSPVVYFLTECLVAVLLAIVSSFAQEYLHNFLAANIGNIGSFIVQTIIAGGLGTVWFVIMLAGGFSAGSVMWYLISRKLIPMMVRVVSSFVMVSVVLIIISSDQLSSAVLPLVIMIYGLLMLVTSVFEKRSMF